MVEEVGDGEVGLHAITPRAARDTVVSRIATGAVNTVNTVVALNANPNTRPRSPAVVASLHHEVGKLLKGQRKLSRAVAGVS